jgi:hypothetical protein
VSNYYYILGHERHTYQAPSLHAAITARLQRSMYHVREGFKRFKVCNPGRHSRGDGDGVLHHPSGVLALGRMHSCSAQPASATVRFWEVPPYSHTYCCWCEDLSCCAGNWLMCRLT